MHLAQIEERLDGAGLRVGDLHHHLVCRSCGLTVHVDGVVGRAPCLDAPSASGFVVDDAEVTFWGYCPACQ